MNKIYQYTVLLFFSVWHFSYTTSGTRDNYSNCEKSPFLAWSSMLSLCAVCSQTSFHVLNIPLIVSIAALSSYPISANHTYFYTPPLHLFKSSGQCSISSEWNSSSPSVIFPRAFFSSILFLPVLKICRKALLYWQLYVQFYCSSTWNRSSFHSNYGIRWLKSCCVTTQA